MLGIYFHIPFCKGRCIYCDFYSTHLHALHAAALQAMKQELCMRAQRLQGVDASHITIYFGGGTPSLLPPEQLNDLAMHAVRVLGAGSIVEYTLEANPEDITKQYIEQLRCMGVSRLSLGVQSTSNGRLKWMRRRHTAQQALRSISMIQNAGISNISVDLIYGLPHQTIQQWRSALQTILQTGIPHLSAYCLTLHANTALHRMVAAAQTTMPSDEQCARLYDALCTEAARHGLEHYEVSNFAVAGMHSKHNAIYWRGYPYIGIGAGAHSYISGRRWWNACNLTSYIQAMAHGATCGGGELLTADDRYNEALINGLRTIYGVDAAALSMQQQARLWRSAQHYIDRGMLTRQGDTLAMPHGWWFVGDSIVRGMLIV
jgi:oxygen-independent coproporphyrinogen-3 oxidase